MIGLAHIGTMWTHRAEYVDISLRGHVDPWARRSVGTLVLGHVGLRTWTHRSVGTSVRGHIGPLTHRAEYVDTLVHGNVCPWAHRSVNTSV